MTAYSIRQVTSTIPQNERVILQRLFENLLANTEFGYTLFGDKPISLLGPLATSRLVELLFRDTISLLLRIGLPVWKKYEPAGTCKNFSFKIDGGSVYIVNKKALRDVIEENSAYFSDILQERVTASTIVERILHEDHFLELLTKNDLLAGILFGYGTENALLFSRYIQVERMLAHAWKENLLLCTPSTRFTTLEKERTFINSILIGTSTFFKHNALEAIYPICFRTTQSEKSLASIQKYRSMQRQLSVIFASDNMLETIYNQFAQ